MAQSFEDECFSDGDLDLLASHTINELENQVLQSTQQKKTETQSTHAQELHLRGRLNQVDSARESYAKDVGPEASSDYGLDDEDIIDLDLNQYAFSDQPQAPKAELPSGRIQDKERRSNTPGQEQQLRTVLRARQPVSLTSRPAQHVNTSTIASNDLPSHNAQGGSDGIEVAESAHEHTMSDTSNREELYSRIQKLEQELATAQKSVEDAKSKAIAKAGETAIVRSNHEKSIREYEQRLASVQISHAHEVARQKAELEASKKNREKIETSNLFLQHELNQEAQRSKHNRKANRETFHSPRKEAGQDSPAITPRKNRSVLFGDGFDTGEEMLVSPSKSKGKSKASTPKHNGKRKRNVTEASPAQALPLQEPQLDTSTPKNVDAGREDPDAALASFRPEDEKFHFIQLLLAHAPRAGHAETIEAFAKHSFPSNPRKTLSSIFYEELLLLTDAKDVAELSLCTCNIMFTLWIRCREDSYYDPLYLIVEALQYIIRTQPMRVSVAIVDKLLPLAFSTIDLIAIPVVTSVNSKLASKPKAADHRLKENINVFEILSLVHRVALCCAQSYDDDGDAKVKFWKKAEYDFVLLMLNIAQPLEQIDLMLQILCTSSLPDSIGTVLDQPDPVRQARKEGVLLDLITYLLIEKPVSPGTQETSTLSKPSTLPSLSTRYPRDTPNSSPPSSPYSRTQIAQLRYSVITVLATFIHHPHGGRALATHRTTLGRLVSFVHDAFKSLYSLNPMIPAHMLSSTSSSSLLTSSSPSPSSSSSSPVRAATIASINMAVRVLYHVFTQYADLVNVREKLAAVPGAAQKHLVALGRIAFCEGAANEEESPDERQQHKDQDGKADENDDAMDVEKTTQDKENGNTNADADANLPNMANTNNNTLSTTTSTTTSSCLSVMEEGIEEEVIEAAHMMLEEFLTPEEGEALVAAFVPDVARRSGGGGGEGGGGGGGGGNNNDADDTDESDDTDDSAEDSDMNEESTLERAQRYHEEDYYNNLGVECGFDV